jgi:hypothetical protein
MQSLSTPVPRVPLARRHPVSVKSRGTLAAWRRMAILGLAVCGSWLGGAVGALAGTITLMDGNSSVTLDPSSSAGVTSWSVDGINQLYQQWFWYRIGSSSPQYSIDTLGSASIVQSSSAEATISFSGTNGLSISVTYLLTGGAPGSGDADMGESINITNTSGTAQNVSFFQYSNFTLDNVAGGDSVQFQNSNAVSQWNGQETLAETVITPRPNFREAAVVPDTLNELNTIPGYILGQAQGFPSGEPNSNTQSSVVTGDVSWAYEWDRTIDPGSSFLISKDKDLQGVVAPVPEPSTMLLAVAGLLTLLGLPLQRLRGR